MILRSQRTPLVSSINHTQHLYKRLTLLRILIVLSPVFQFVHDEFPNQGFFYIPLFLVRPDFVSYKSGGDREFSLDFEDAEVVHDHVFVEFLGGGGSEDEVGYDLLRGLDVVFVAAVCEENEAVASSVVGEFFLEAL